MTIVQLNQKNFDQIIKEHDSVCLDFWAEWCEPCKAFQKVLEEIAPRYPEFVFAGVNIEEESQLAEDFQIRSVPSVMILRKQVIVYADAGALVASVLMDLLDRSKVIDSKDLEKPL